VTNNSGWYYLHTNGELIFKKYKPELDSDFVKQIWEVIPDERESAWVICIEASALGANPERILNLAEKWGLTNEDGQTFASRVGLVLHEGSETGWMVSDKSNEQQGFGVTALAAFSQYAHQGLVEIKQR